MANVDTETTKNDSKATAKTAATKGAYRKTKRLKASERKQQILEVAKRVIINEGFGQFSSRYVADQSGIRLATLQYYFPTKDELFRAAFEDAVAKERERIDTVVSEDTLKTPGTMLKSRLIGHLRAEQNPETTGIFYQLWAQAYMDEFARKLMDEFYDRNLNLLTDLVAAFNTDLKPLESKRRALMVLAFLEGMTLFMGENKADRPEMEDIETQVLNMIFVMVTTPPQEWP